MLSNLKENLQNQEKRLQKNKIYLTLLVFAMPLQRAIAETVAKKNESSLVFQKFGVAILLVIFFALVIYSLLYLYKKFIASKDEPKTQYLSPDSLESARDMNEAIHIFLEKTKPNQ